MTSWTGVQDYMFDLTPMSSETLATLNGKKDRRAQRISGITSSCAVGSRLVGNEMQAFWECHDTEGMAVNQSCLTSLCDWHACYRFDTIFEGIRESFLPRLRHIHTAAHPTVLLWLPPIAKQTAGVSSRTQRPAPHTPPSAGREWAQRSGVSTQPYVEPSSIESTLACRRLSVNRPGYVCQG